eukprot:SAG31_NODE_1745_length_7379_cov_8.772115_5_plen_55_part_00
MYTGADGTVLPVVTPALPADSVLAAAHNNPICLAPIAHLACNAVAEHSMQDCCT